MKTASFATFAAVLAACDGPSPVQEPAENPTTPPPVERPSASPEPAVTPDIAANVLITPSSIGPAELGMSLAAFRAAMGDVAFEYEPYYMVDFSALCALDEAGKETLCAMVYEVDAENGADEVVALRTEHPAYRTAENVGVGTSLVDAVDVYGPADLGFSYDNESREYVGFERGPRIGVRAGVPGDPGMAGIYGTGASETQTDRFRDGAVITAIEVS